MTSCVGGQWSWTHLRRKMQCNPKSGYLDVKLPSKVRVGIRGWKAWKRRWIVLHSLRDMNSECAVATLDIYQNASTQTQHLERCTIYLEASLQMHRVTSRSHPYAFYVEARASSIYLAATCESDAQDWMVALGRVFWPLRDSGPQTVAVTDAAFSTMFGAQGGVCNLNLNSDNVLLLQCVNTGHVLLEWPTSSLARVYMAENTKPKDHGRVFIIEPRPHSSGWTAPLHLFSLKAKELVQQITNGMQKQPTHNSPPICKTDIIEASTYDHPRGNSICYVVNDPPSSPKPSNAFYDSPRPLVYSVPGALCPSRHRSHSESQLIRGKTLNSPSVPYSCSFSVLPSDDNPIEHHPSKQSRILSRASLCSQNSWITASASVEFLPEESPPSQQPTTTTTTTTKGFYSEIESLREPLYEEVAGVRKPSAFQMDSPPPLPPRHLQGGKREAQKKDVVRFLGIEDPWTKRIVQVQQTSRGTVNKKNLFRFLGSEKGTAVSTLTVEGTLKGRRHKMSFNKMFIRSGEQTDTKQAQNENQSTLNRRFTLPSKYKLQTTNSGRSSPIINQQLPITFLTQEDFEIPYSQTTPQNMQISWIQGSITTETKTQIIPSVLKNLCLQTDSPSVIRKQRLPLQLTDPIRRQISNLIPPDIFPEMLHFSLMYISWISEHNCWIKCFRLKLEQKGCRQLPDNDDDIVPFLNLMNISPTLFHSFKQFCDLQNH